MENFTKNGKKILGAALNYKNPNGSKPADPVLFLKPSTSYITEGGDIVIPDVLTNVFHEVELGVIISDHCRHVSVSDAHKYIGGYCLGLDLSAMCELVSIDNSEKITETTEILLGLLQTSARANGFPWSMGKGFDTSNPVSRFIHLNEINDLHNLDMYLNVNGVQKQCGNTKDLIYNSFELIAYASKYMTLEPYDLIMTGTPKGASQIVAGDTIEAGLSENGIQLVKMIFYVK